jgi:hypothetical protein
MMKRLLTTALVGLAGAALSVSTANAQTTTTANAGDLILGFYATSGTGAGTDLEVDLGSIANFESYAPGSIISLNGTAGLQAADLAATYGSTWFDNPDLFWGTVSGNTITQVGNSTPDSFWGTDPELTPGTPSTPYTVEARSQQASGSSSGLSVITGLNSNVATPTSDSSVSANLPQSYADSYYSQDTFGTGSTFNFLTGKFLTDNAVTNILSSTGYSLSQLDELIPGSGNVNEGDPAKVLGTLELYAGPNTALDGTLVFVTAPEPSSIGLAGVGFLSLIGFVALRRRRSIMA